MGENKQDSEVDVLIKDLAISEFQKILDCTIEDLLLKAWEEQWKIKHIEFWLKVKNAQNFEAILDQVEDLKIHLENIEEDTKNINANIAEISEKT